MRCVAGEAICAPTVEPTDEVCNGIDDDCDGTTDEEVFEFCRGRIAHFKVPRYVKFVTEFPMSITGKIQKFRMREVSIKELALEDVSRIETA